MPRRGTSCRDSTSLPAQSCRSRYTRPVSLEIARLRPDARAAFDAAVAAVQPGRLLAQKLHVEGRRLVVAGKAFDVGNGRLMVAALGKAAPGLAAAWLELAGDLDHELFILTPHDVATPPILDGRGSVSRGGHPEPDAAGAAATCDLLSRASSLGPDDTLFVLLSGGASSLLAETHRGITLDDLRATTSTLLRSGATIGELNTVRRELLVAAGGGLARAAMPARVATVALSDVIGSPPADIASGPTAPPPTTAADALAVLDRRGLMAEVPASIVEALRHRDEEPVEHDAGLDTLFTVLGDITTAVMAAAGELETRGYQVLVEPRPLQGEAAVEGRRLGRDLVACSSPSARVVGGETTVTVRGPGSGGRNQELALAAALEIAGAASCVLLAAGSDGVDGPTANAGAVVDSTTVGRLQALGIDATVALAANDSATALAGVGDTLVTGPTGTNVGDLVVTLR